MDWELVGNVSHGLLLAGAGWWLTRSPAWLAVGWVLLGAGAADALGVLAGQHGEISPKTVQNHVSNVLLKSGVEHRAQAVARARDANVHRPT
ncbi:LuxR C-terminal-related transcriptional regulator [Micromonospora cremea]|uniref:Regulatory protein, luxR family n=1 Tax=Micromonospora cremea TaxID=709881 RepID=A0A1N5ZWP9_9ACTN|nr:LuxR C-terminal-related transcriptional regulator [Micromonospora cremea]SIN26192.1 regulatory protein, luxR family [Micromonospora cremea]